MIGLISSTRFAPPMPRVSVPSTEGRVKQAIRMAKNTSRSNIAGPMGHYDRLPTLADEVARQQVNVIAAITTPVALAVKATTTTIPTVFEVGGDYSGSRSSLDLSQASVVLAATSRVWLCRMPNLVQNDWSFCISWFRRRALPHLSTRPPIPIPYLCPRNWKWQPDQWGFSFAFFALRRKVIYMQRFRQSVTCTSGRSLSGPIPSSTIAVRNWLQWLCIREYRRSINIVILLAAGGL